MRKSTVLIIIGALVVAVAAPGWAWDWTTPVYNGPAAPTRDVTTGYFISTINVPQTGYAQWVSFSLGGHTEAFTGDWRMGIRAPNGDIYYDGMSGTDSAEESWAVTDGALLTTYFGGRSTPSDGEWAYIMEWPTKVAAGIDGWQLQIQGTNEPLGDNSPEPATWLLLACTGGVSAILRRRRKAA